MSRGARNPLLARLLSGTVLTISEQAALEDLKEELRGLYIRPGEDIQDPRRGRHAFDLGNQGLLFMDALMDKYTDKRGLAANQEVRVLGRMIEQTLSAGLRWYEETGRMLTKERWEALGRPAAIGADGLPLKKLA